MNKASTVAESDVRAAVGVALTKAMDAVKYLVTPDRVGAEGRVLLAGALHAEDPRLLDVALSGKRYDKEPFVTIVCDIFHSLGVDNGAIIPNALRAHVLDALGFLEPPPPPWLEPGLRIFEEWRGARGEPVTVARVTPEGVVLRNASGREEEPVPMGLFLAAHPFPPSPMILGQTLTTDLHTTVGPPPKLAQHQVWRTINGGDLVVVGGDIADGMMKARTPDGQTMPVPSHYFRNWECIGVQLADGRRMLVGETWTYDGGVMSKLLRVVAAGPLGHYENGAAAFEVKAENKPEPGVLRFSSIRAIDPRGWRKVESGTVTIHSHVVDTSGWCTRCGSGNIDGSCVSGRAHLPRGGGSCPGCATCQPAQTNGGDIVICGGAAGDFLGSEITFEFSREDYPAIRNAFAKLADCHAGFSVAIAINSAYTMTFVVSPLDVERSGMGNTCYASARAFGEVARAIDCTLATGKQSEVAVRFNGAARVVVRLHEREKWQPFKPAAAARLPSPEGLAALRSFWGALLAVVRSEAFRKDAYRREVDAAMANADASTAERAAMLAACERHRPFVCRIPEFIEALRRYEAGRARGMTPARAMLEVDGFDLSAPDIWSGLGLDVYERERTRRG